MSLVRVKHPADIIKLETALHLARRQILERMASREGAVDSAPAIERLLHRKMVETLKILHLCVKATQEESSAADMGATEKEIAALDAKVHDFQQMVEEAACRVAKLRADVPAALSKHFKARLQACRPLRLNEDPDAAAATEQDGDEALPAALSPAPAELRGKLSDAATQLPILRAELEEKLARLQRIVGAMNGEDQPAAEPGTVERAARGMATPGPAGGVPSPKLAQAVSGGKIATRRRVLTNLARPVPYALRG